MIKIDEPERHLYLYAKYWYKRTDNIVADLKPYIARIIGLDTEQIKEDSIIYWLFKLVSQHYDWNLEMTELLSDLDPNNVWRVGYPNEKKYDYQTAIIYKLVSMLNMVQVIDGDTLLVDIGEPDYTLYERREK
jgi:hypothetical protein